MKKTRYEIIAWDGFAGWGKNNAHTRRIAEECQLNSFNLYPDVWKDIKIYDNELRIFV